MKNKKISIIGHFGGNENILDGQTIKTKILYDELKNATDWKIKKVDTYYKRKNPLKLIKDLIIAILNTNDIIILLSRNGMKLFFPLLSFSAKLFNKRIYHDVIGGNLDIYVQKYPKYKKYLNSFVVNWVETEGLKNKLLKQEINNCEVIPNFKRLNVVDVKNKEYDEPFRFCIFSRVMKEKGIETAIEAIERINKESNRMICTLDIYGRIDEGYKDRFEEVIDNTTDAVVYKGMVSYDQSTNVIKDYYALLFPTYWDGEGFPGTIVDAFSAGLPVIASNWNCNSEIVENEVNGILYPNKTNKDLKDSIQWLIKHKDNMYKLKSNCIISAKKYQPDEHIIKIVNRIES